MLSVAVLLVALVVVTRGSPELVLSTEDKKTADCLARVGRGERWAIELCGLRYFFVGGFQHSGTGLLRYALAEHPLVRRHEHTGVREDEGQHLQTVFPSGADRRRHGSVSARCGCGGPACYYYCPRLQEAAIADADRERLYREWFGGRPNMTDTGFALEKSPDFLVQMRAAIFPNVSTHLLMVRHPFCTGLDSRAAGIHTAADALDAWLRVWRDVVLRQLPRLPPQLPPLPPPRSSGPTVPTAVVGRPLSPLYIVRFEDLATDFAAVRDELWRRVNLPPLPTAPETTAAAAVATATAASPPVAVTKPGRGAIAGGLSRNGNRRRLHPQSPPRAGMANDFVDGHGCDAVPAAQTSRRSASFSAPEVAGATAAGEALRADEPHCRHCRRSRHHPAGGFTSGSRRRRRRRLEFHGAVPPEEESAGDADAMVWDSKDCSLLYECAESAACRRLWRDSREVTAFFGYELATKESEVEKRAREKRPALEDRLPGRPLRERSDSGGEKAWDTRQLAPLAAAHWGLPPPA